MSKTHYFINHFSKIAKCWRLSGRFCCSEVARFAQIAVVQTDYNEIELQKISYDVILVTLSILRHRLVPVSEKNIPREFILAQTKILHEKIFSRNIDNIKCKEKYQLIR